MTPAQTGESAIRPLLYRLGLDENETEIYLALLALKSAPASAIAKQAKQQRSNTYLILRSLTEKGLVSEIERGKILHFVAEPPERLVSYAEDRAEEMKSIKTLMEGALPLLKSITQPLVGKPRVTMHTGMDGMRQVYRDALKNDFCGVFNAEKMYEAFGKKAVNALFGSYFQLHGRDLIVDNKAGRAYLEEVKSEKTLQSKLLPKGCSFASDMLIFDDTIALFAYDNEQTVVRIQNQELANTHKALFEMLWSQAK